MDIEGKWWILLEDEPLDIERSRLYDLRAGQAFDVHSGEPVGTYDAGAGVTAITLNDEPGDNTMYLLRVGTDSEDLDACRADWSSSGFELYRASWPIPDYETEEDEIAREDWERRHFGMRVTFGFAMRDGPEIQKLNDQNVVDLAATVH